MEFVNCLIYLASIGIAGFIIGRFLPDKMFSTNAFPYKTYKFEKGGRIYEKIGVKCWKDKLIDMSKIFPFLMPTKQLYGEEDMQQKLPVFIKETCTAEFTHAILALAGFYCLKIWNGIGGVCVSLLYFLGNVPFIIVQRYNRPRLVCILERKQQSAARKQTKGDS